MTKPILTSLYVEYSNKGELASPQLSVHQKNTSLSSHSTYGLRAEKRQKTYIKLVQKSVSHRRTIEGFIQQQYKKHFDAEIQQFFPVLISVYHTSSDNLLASVGIRYADQEDLFSEQYLAKPVEHLLGKQAGKKVQRSSVIELGHFALAHRRHLVPVVRAIAQFIGQLRVDWAVYTLSQPMVNAVNRLQIPTQFLGFAEADKLHDQDNNWGQYYHLNPAVYCSHTATAIKAIHQGRDSHGKH